MLLFRWGLGRTGVPPSYSPQGVPEWAIVIDEVLDRLNIDRCSIMAHSAGAPYALSFASKYPERIIGDVCLLAPWVGGGFSGSSILISDLYSRFLTCCQVVTDGSSMFPMAY